MDGRPAPADCERGRPLEAGGHGINSRYDFGAVESAEIVRTVTATGSVAATINVEVGSQLSGQIVKIRADFNDVVRKGQVLAELDDSTFRVQVASAGAALEGAEADVRVAEAKLAHADIEVDQVETQRGVWPRGSTSLGPRLRSRCGRPSGNPRSTPRA